MLGAVCIGGLWFGVTKNRSGLFFFEIPGGGDILAGGLANFCLGQGLSEIGGNCYRFIFYVVVDAIATI